MELEIGKINKVYLAGIGGIGLSALAYYFLQKNKLVTGSDLVESEVTKRLQSQNVKINFEQKAANITEDIDLFLYSSALPENHPELAQAREYDIPCYSYFDFVGYLSRQYKTIAVAGTNGKTTTTAMIGLALEKAGIDPTVIVGSLVPQWGTNFRLGNSEWLVVEACEWQAHMLKIKPQIIVLTNISEDHLDYYKNLDDIKNHFAKFVDKLPMDGLLIKNADDVNSTLLTFDNMLTFGQKNSSYGFSEPQIKNSMQSFVISKDGQELNQLELHVPGIYNVYNAVACVAVADQLKVNRHQIWNALREFTGTWRRFEIVGKYKTNTIISDYAHHPDSIDGLMQAAKDFYPDRKIIAVFQPHHQNRTKNLLDKFSKSFGLADTVIISEIYHVSGRESEADNISAKALADKIVSDKPVYFCADFKSIKQKLREIDPSEAVVLFIGAGDIDNLARELAS